MTSNPPTPPKKQNTEMFWVVDLLQNIFRPIKLLVVFTIEEKTLFSSKF